MYRFSPLARVLTMTVLLLSLTGLASAQDEEEVMVVEEAPTPRLVDVIATDFKYEPERLTLPAGPTTFSVRNIGVLDHNFVIESPSGSVIAAINNIVAGRSATLDVTLVPGTFPIVCTLPAHKDAGMVGTLTVTP